MSFLELSVSKLWHHGPEWLSTAMLSQHETRTSTMPEECASEMKKTIHTLLTTETKGNIDCRRCSTLSRLVKVTAYVLRAIQLFKGSLSTKPSALSTAELADAEKKWIISVQSILPGDKSFTSWKRQFNLFEDDQGFWRCGGRLANATIPYNTKYPLLLPREHHYTTLIIQDAHIKVGHDGVKETFWIIKGRSLVRSIIHQCVLCR